MAQTKTRTKRRTSSNGRANGSSPQTKRYAQQAARKADRKRQKAEGASAWVAERAGDWDLDAQDLAWMERQKYFWNPLIDYWFRMEMEGWERLPEPPALLIGVHSGAPFVWDAWTVGIQWWRHFGDERTLHGTAHDAIVPISTVGGPDSMPVLFSGRKLARALRLDQIARLKMFPVAISAPWGIGPALLPEIPLPTKIRTAFQEPIEVDHDPERAEDR